MQTWFFLVLSAIIVLVARGDPIVVDHDIGTVGTTFPTCAGITFACPGGNNFYSVTPQGGGNILYFSCYSPARNGPLFTINEVSPATMGVAGQNKERPSVWSRNGPRVINGNGDTFVDGNSWHRGHMVTRSDCASSQARSDATSHVINRVPQAGTFNSLYWMKMEKAIQRFTRDQNRPICIITIANYGDATTITESGFGGVAVARPTQMAKVIYMGGVAPNGQGEHHIAAGFLGGENGSDRTVYPPLSALAGNSFPTYITGYEGTVHLEAAALRALWDALFPDTYQAVISSSFAGGPPPSCDKAPYFVTSKVDLRQVQGDRIHLGNGMYGSPSQTEYTIHTAGGSPTPGCIEGCGLTFQDANVLPRGLADDEVRANVGTYRGDLTTFGQGIVNEGRFRLRPTRHEAPTALVMMGSMTFVCSITRERQAYLEQVAAAAAAAERAKRFRNNDKFLLKKRAKGGDKDAADKLRKQRMDDLRKATKKDQKQAERFGGKRAKAGAKVSTKTKVPARFQGKAGIAYLRRQSAKKAKRGGGGGGGACGLDGETCSIQPISAACQEVLTPTLKTMTLMGFGSYAKAYASTPVTGRGGLTREEESAVKAYISEEDKLYIKLNCMLTNPGVSQTTPVPGWVTQLNGLLTSALQKAQTHKKVTYRAAQLTVTPQVGETIHNLGFLGTSANPEFAVAFTGCNPCSRIEFDSAEGRYTQQFTGASTQSEILILSNQCWKVIAVETGTSPKLMTSFPWAKSGGTDTFVKLTRVPCAGNERSILSTQEIGYDDFNSSFEMKNMDNELNEIQDFLEDDTI
jgi:hypothetical protein